MRPIKLKIKGLNSFMEEQIIDFTELTSRGLFGIIGPTGSGKTTILDGITLALYGEVARKSKNFINSNCNAAQISFEYQISGATTKRYVVEREFKVDKKTGNSRSGKCKLLDVTSGEPEVLADSVGGVTSACKEIIGLTLEDFTRTVVLPQGKFSEFLKLEGADRRNMLERLFHLQEYGDHLAKKLAAQVTKAKEENTYLAGQMMGYEGFDENRLKEKEEEQKEISDMLKKAVKENKEFFVAYQSYEELWELLKEKEQCQQSQTRLLLQQEDMDEIKQRAAKCESALTVEPYYCSLTETTKEMEQAIHLLEQLKEQEQEAQKEKELAEQQFLIWQQKKEEELPKLAVKEQKAKDALEEEKLLLKLEQEMIYWTGQKKESEKKKISLDQTIAAVESNLMKQKLQVNQLEEQIQTLKVDTEYKEQLNQGANLSIQIKDILTRLAKQKKKEEEKLNLIKQQQNQLLKDKELLVNVQENRLHMKEKMEELIKANPESQEDLLMLQSKANAAKEALKQVREIKESMTHLEKELTEATKKKEEKERQVKLLQEQVTKQKELEENKKQSYLAAQLRNTLVEGQPCPVCGSVHHSLKQFEQETELVQQEDNIDLPLFEQRLLDANQELTDITYHVMTTKTLWEQQLSQLNTFNETKDYEQASLLALQFSQLKVKMEQYKEKKERLEKESTQTELEENKLVSSIKAQKQMIASNKEDLMELQETIESLLETSNELKKEYNELARVTGTREFRAMYEAVLNKEKQREDCMKQLADYRLELEQKQALLAEEKESKKQVEETLAKIETTIRMNQNSIEERKQSIVDKVGVCNHIAAILQETIHKIQQIQTGFQTAKEQKQKLDDSYLKVKDQLITVSANSQELINRKEREEKELTVRMNEQGFSSVTELLSFLCSKQELIQMKEQLSYYQEQLAKLKGAMERVESKIGGRSLTKEQWDEMNQKKERLEEQQEKLKEQQIKLNADVVQMKQKIAELGELLLKKQAVQQRLDRLTDLEKLFKGKKFVEYVASTRLKYISIEASKKLKEITNDTYGLEVDENGKFFIRDYKNGGAARDASTLSGGETFVASLALALALSAQIQLKGTAPLELFFLDEGFGTLDENLLDVVMTSIEQIHNDKLKVGLITHVESVKNRVPVKLIVSPAESGRGGSKVKIEYN